MFTIVEHVQGVEVLRIERLRADIHATAVALILSESRDARSRFTVTDDDTGRVTATGSTGCRLGEPHV